MRQQSLSSLFTQAIYKLLHQDLALGASSGDSWPWTAEGSSLSAVASVRIEPCKGAKPSWRCFLREDLGNGITASAVTLGRWENIVRHVRITCLASSYASPEWLRFFRTSTKQPSRFANFRMRFERWKTTKIGQQHHGGSQGGTIHVNNLLLLLLLHQDLALHNSERRHPRQPWCKARSSFFVNVLNPISSTALALSPRCVNSSKSQLMVSNLTRREHDVY